MPSEAEILVRLDDLLEATVQQLTDAVVATVVADVEREWRNALTAAADFAALAVSDEPSPEEVDEVRRYTTEALFLAAFLMLLLFGVNDAQAQAVALGLSTPGSLAPRAITDRLRVLREIVSVRVAQVFNDAIRRGSSQDDALAKALRQAENSARIFAEIEALAAVNGGIDSLGDFLNQQGIPTTKTWRTRRDERVRETHSATEGQEVPFGSYFNVGGWPMQYPGDRSAPPQLWANCRCIMVLGSPSPLTGIGG